MSMTLRVFAPALLVFGLLGPAAAQAPPTPIPLATPGAMDERALIAIADGIDHAVDTKDWAKARGFFADMVDVDFSSLGGGPPATIRSDDLIAGWSGNLKPSKTSLHLRTNHLVAIAGDEASMTSHGYAWNRMEGNGDPLWEVWGLYEHRFRRTGEGWRVTGFVFRMTHERGNMWVKTTVPPS